VAIGVLSLAGILILGGGLSASRWATGRRGGPAIGEGSNVERLAETLFTRYLFAFEVTSVLLVIAVVGAVVLARRSRIANVDDDADDGADAEADADAEVVA
jgi:NADH-quinone oxidoreductase subunit J